MPRTYSQLIIDRMDWLDTVAEKVQPKVQEAIGKGGVGMRNALDGTWLGAPLHPALSDVPIGSWTAALIFDGLDAATGSKAIRNAADAALAMGVAHALLNGAGLDLSITSLVLRARGRRNAGRLAFLAGYSLVGLGAHLGGELSYGYGLRVNRDVFEGSGPDEFTPVLEESELADSGMSSVEAGGTQILLSRTSDGRICAISNVCNHFSGPLAEGNREGGTVVCPLHQSRFDLCTGEAIDGPAVFPQSRYETRVREGTIEVRSDPENVQKKVV